MNFYWQNNVSAFNKLSNLVITFLPRSKHLLISRLQSPSAVILEPKKIVSHCFHCYPICHKVTEPDAIILIFWMLSFMSSFSLSSFTFIKRLFRSSSLSAIRVVSSASISEVIDISPWQSWFQLVLHPAQHFTWCTLRIRKISRVTIYSLDTPFAIWIQAVVPCPVLTVASWPAYRFLRRQVRLSGIPISFRIFHSLLWSTQSKALA